MLKEPSIPTDQGRFFIRPCEEADEEKVLSLWRAAFLKPMDPALWRWKWRENPYGRQMMLCIGEDGTPAAMYSGIPYRANHHGREVRFTHLMDHCSHPEYRSVLGGKKGLFVRTAAAFFDRYGGPWASVFMYGFPGKRHFRLGQKLLRYEPLRGGTTYLAAPPSQWTFRSKAFGGRIRPVDTLSDAFDAFFAACRARYPLTVIRDAEFLHWRFRRHPRRKYEIWTHHPLLGMSMNAYAVLYHEPQSSCIVDILCPGPGNRFQDFMARLRRVLMERGVSRVNVWLPPSHFLTPALVSGGFRGAPEPFGFIPGGRTFHSTLNMGRMSEDLFYTMGDGDLF